MLCYPVGAVSTSGVIGLPFAVPEVRSLAADEGGDSIGAGVGGGYAVCRASVASGRGLDSQSWSSSRSSCKEEISLL